jgi:hypothetical protein
MAGGFDFGFTYGFEVTAISGVITVPNIDYTHDGESTEITKIPVTSGATVYLSGVREDVNLNLFYDPATDGFAYIKAGGYLNGQITGSGNLTSTGYYAWSEFDGSKARQAGGSYQFYTNTSGNLYAWTRRVV